MGYYTETTALNVWNIGEDEFQLYIMVITNFDFQEIIWS